MKNKEEISTELDFDKKNSIFELWNSLKNSIFNVLFVLLDSNDGDAIPLNVYYEAGIDFVQMFEFPFNDAVQTAWNGGETLERITAFIGIFNIVSYLPSVGFNTFLAELYALIIGIIIIIIDIVYVSYSFSKKRFRFTWPLVILGQIVPLFVTVFFIPITEILLSVVQCNPLQEAPFHQVMSEYPEIVCWKGWHLFHAIITLIFCSIFIFISTIVALAMFEPRMTSSSASARQNSNAEIAFIINKIVCQFIFNFIPFDDSGIYAVMLFVLSAWMFYAYCIKSPNYNKSVSKFYRICSSYYFWTNFMLIVSQILQKWNFNGGLVAWIGGLPFIAIIIIFQKQSSIDALFSSNLKFRSGQQLQLHIHNVLMLIQTRQTDKNSYMLLIGYIQKHKQVCNQQDCPLKSSRRKKDDQAGQMEQNCKQLIKQLDRMYQSGLRKYSNSTKLRLSYAFFHLQRTKNKNKAYEQFVRSEKTNPNFSQQFIIYRFKKIIKQNLQDDEDEQNDSDLIELIKFDNHVSLCQQAMLLSVKLHKQFWTELRQQTPDLIKLNQIGSRITQTIQTVSSNFDELVKIQSSIPFVLHNYAVYLISILQQPYRGEKILEMYRKAEQQKLFEASQESMGDNYLEKFQNENIALLVVSAKQQDLGKIIRSNLVFTEVFGYFKQQITDWKFDKLLPQIYSQYHSNFMHKWLQQGNEKSKYLLNEHQAFLKQKTGYIVPIIYQVAFNPIQQIFLSHFKLDFSHKKSYGYMLVDPKGYIKDITSSIYSLVDINKEDIKKDQIKIQDIFPNILSEVQDFVEPRYLDFEFRGLRDRCSIMIQKITITKQNIDDENQQEQLMKENKYLLGYSFRLQKAEKRHATSASLTRQQQQQQQFHSSRTDSFENQNSQLLRLYNHNQLDDYEYVEQSEREEMQFINYGVKIKTLRLTKNELHMIYDGSEEDFENDFQQSDDQDLGKVRFDDQRYTQVIKNAINTNLDHVQITFFRWTSFIFMLILDAVLVVGFVMTLNLFDKITFYSHNVNARGQTLIFLNNMYANTLVTPPQIAYDDAVKMIDSFANDFDTTLMVNVLLQDNKTIVKDVNDAIVLVLGRLRQFYSNNSSPSSMKVTYQNFFSNLILPMFFYVQQFPSNNSLIPTLICMIVSFILSFGICLVWIGVILKIQKKRFDILIWFLDIPIPYVTFLTLKCDRFLKSFSGMKYIMNEDKTDELFEEYVDKKDQGENQIQQQQKARKSLIARHKKKKLLSRLNWSFLKYFILMIIFCSFPCFNYIILNQSVKTALFLKPEYDDLAQQCSKVGCLNIASMIMEQNIQLQAPLPLIITQLKNSYAGNFGKNNLKQFNLDILSYKGQLSQRYEQTYFKNICFYYPNDTKCTIVLNGNLGNGALSLMQYLHLRPMTNINQTQFLQSNLNYIQPSFIKLLNLFKSTISSVLDSSTNKITIFLYVFIIGVFFVFISFWLMWLKGLNTGLNQTIKMLNMIPLKVLPSSNRETKRFIRWIIKQSNKKKHQQD